MLAATSAREDTPSAVSSPNFGGRPKACIAFGPGGMAEAHDCNSLDQVGSLPQTGNNTAGWVIELDSGLALLHEEASTVTIWSGSEFTEIDLGDLVSPVGGAYLDGKLYVACFGSWPTPLGDSGLAVVDVLGRRLESTHPFSDPNMHLHNAFAFEFGGQREVFVANIGDPWTKSGPIAGWGLSRFDRSSSAFEPHTTSANLSIRSAKQQLDGSIFALTQEPSGQDTKLVRIEERGSQLEVITQTILPPRSGGDGGADVVLGVERDTIWVTDRQGWEPGRLYYYTYSSGSFTMINARDTGALPRYMVTLDNGDVITCNQNGNDLSVFPGLAFNPLNTSIAEHRIQTLSSPKFFIQTSKIAAAQWIQV